MRRFLFLLSLITVLISNVSAQFNGDGFYRVQNRGTNRYMFIVDNTGKLDKVREDGDFGSLQLIKGKEKTISDPASILYIKKVGSQIDIQGQGVGLYQIINRYVDLSYVSSGAFKGTYMVSASESGVTKYLDDEETSLDKEVGGVGFNRSSPYRNWYIHPVSSSSDNYFGVTPLDSVIVNNKYYYPLYVAFPFKPASSGMKVYTVSKYDIQLGYAVLSEISGVVPARTPVLIECSSLSATNNRLDLVDSSVSPLSGNCLSGVFFCNYDRMNRYAWSSCITEFKPANMRVIGLTSQGKLGYVTSTKYMNEIEGSYYLPANTSFMYVPSNCPAELTAVTETEYDQILANHQYTITYMVDGQVYKTEKLKAGQAITAETPTRDGYTFSGWNGLPATMPAKDITVTGSFTPINYKLIYVLDGVEYKTVPVPCGSTVTPLEVTKEGYVFSGWSGLPTTMPAHDVTVTGSFSIGSYKLIYMIDGNVYQTQTLVYGDAVTPLPNPVRDGYTFNGWSAIPATMPGHDVTITGSFTPLVYTIQYMVDGQILQQQQVPCGQTLTPPTPPEKDGYTFKEWGGLPAVMPAGNLTVTAVYDPKIYILTYMVDGDVYKTVEVPCGSVITPIAYPVKEGYKFSGWANIPDKMPASNVTVKGTFSIGIYTLEYILNGAKYKDYVYFSRTYKYGQSITPYTQSPGNIAGYTFMGWGEIPEKMPGHDVKVYGWYKGNDYTVTYVIDGAEYKKITVPCGDVIPDMTMPEKTGYTFSGWDNLPTTMPAKNITVTGKFSINSYVLKYVLEIGEKGGTQLFRSNRYTYGTQVKALTSAPSRFGYTFMGWDKVPATMPASNVTVRGRYQANIYKVSYYVGSKMVHQQDVAYDDSIPAYTYYSDDFIITDADWQGIRYVSMPAQNLIFTCSQEIIDRLNALRTEEEEGNMIFDLSGRRVSAMKAKGLYIINGKKIFKQ
jgi:uncharacterized repeat protein (TIGR02543 family)